MSDAPKGIATGYAEAAADMADFDARVRAVVDARLLAFAEHLKAGGQRLNLAADIHAFLLAAPARQDAQAPTPGLWNSLTPDQQRRALAYDGPQDLGEPVRDVSEVPSLSGVVRDHFATPPAEPAAPAPSGVAGEDVGT